MRNRTQDMIEQVKTGKDARLNEMLNPQCIEEDSVLKTSKIIFKTEDWMKNQRDELHGGAIMAMFDTAMGVSGSAMAGYESVSTVDLQTSFIRPFIGEAFVFTTKVTSAGRTLVRTTCIAQEFGSDRILATATGTFIPFTKKSGNNKY